MIEVYATVTVSALHLARNDVVEVAGVPLLVHDLRALGAGRKEVRFHGGWSLIVPARATLTVRRRAPLRRSAGRHRPVSPRAGT